MLKTSINNVRLGNCRPVYFLDFMAQTIWVWVRGAIGTRVSSPLCQYLLKNWQLRTDGRYQTARSNRGYTSRRETESRRLRAAATT